MLVMRVFFIEQEAYTKKILKRFKMDECNPVSTPVVINQDEEEIGKLSSQVPYREAVGSLMYLMMNTRPDITYSVSLVAQDLDKPTEQSWRAVKRIYRYLKGTQNHGILFKTDGNPSLQVYCDADYAGDVKTRLSRTGIVTMLASGPISWYSSKQKCIAVSTTEAEYVAASEATKELIWLKRLLSELMVLNKLPVLYVDNAGAVKLCHNPEFHKRTKHIDVRHHFVRENVEKNNLKVEHVKGELQKADIFTKSLPKPRFEYLRKIIGMVCGVTFRGGVGM